jgi:hypothetical protein
MESQRFEKIGGLPQAIVPSTEPLLCQYRDARGRGCRMPVSALSDHLTEESGLDISTDGLCAFHARRLLDRHRAGQTAAADLLASVGEFKDPASVNRFLANLARMVALRRIPRRDGVVLAYIAQLILNSQAAQDRKELVAYELERLYDLKHPPRVVWGLPSRSNRPAQAAGAQPSANPGSSTTERSHPPGCACAYCLPQIGGVDSIQRAP